MVMVVVVTPGADAVRAALELALEVGLELGLELDEHAATSR